MYDEFAGYKSDKMFKKLIYDQKYNGLLYTSQKYNSYLKEKLIG